VKARRPCCSSGVGLQAFLNESHTQGREGRGALVSTTDVLGLVLFLASGGAPTALARRRRADHHGVFTHHCARDAAHPSLYFCSVSTASLITAPPRRRLSCLNECLSFFFALELVDIYVYTLTQTHGVEDLAPGGLPTRTATTAAMQQQYWRLRDATDQTRARRSKVGQAVKPTCGVDKGRARQQPLGFPRLPAPRVPQRRGRLSACHASAAECAWILRVWSRCRWWYSIGCKDRGKQRQQCEHARSPPLHKQPPSRRAAPRPTPTAEG